MVSPGSFLVFCTA